MKRVFIGLEEISGRYRALKYGFDLLRVPCTLAIIYPNRFGYHGAKTNWLIRIAAACYLKDQKAKSSSSPLRILKRFFWKSITESLKVPLFVWALATHDIFIFSGGSSFFKFMDYRILSYFGKFIICQFHGSDSRPPYLDGARVNTESKMTPQACFKLTKQLKKNIRIIEKYANVLINTPPQAYFHERPFVNRLLVGIPSGPFAESIESSSHKLNSSCRILHAPSSIKIKGTIELRKIIESLKNKGHSIDYVEISDVSNTNVIEEIKKCDFVLDQMYVDFGMPGLATEAACFGKPTILGGYASELWPQILTEDELPPSLYCSPENISDAIEKLVVDKTFREDLGEKAFNFISRRWDPKSVASNYLMLVDGTYPKRWECTPIQSTTEIWGGYFMSKRAAQTSVAELIEFGGIRALALEDKPALEKSLVDFAKSLK